ncbi:hypothetical protein [Rhodoplanes sp. SY1]|uniref:hypothetical protein n=1 Tax=Rhodoplanes sp. SY1 TaxID=3166646 RepID=UPI0038B58529
MTVAPEVISKGAFAQLIGVSAGRVSQYIREGKLDGAALVGEGRGAGIRVAVAQEQLRRRLDIGQRLGNGIGTRLAPPAAATDATAAPADVLPFAAPPAPPTAPVGSAVDPIDERIRQAKLEGIERENRKRAEEEAARAGRYVLADQTRAEMVRLARDMLTVFEGALVDLATAIAARHQLQQRDVLHALRAEFRTIRAKAAAAARARAAELPPLIEDADPSAPQPPTSPPTPATNAVAP